MPARFERPHHQAPTDPQSIALQIQSLAVTVDRLDLEVRAHLTQTIPTAVTLWLTALDLSPDTAEACRDALRRTLTQLDDIVTQYHRARAVLATLDGR